jgi:peptidoglycan LD-endopeptidase LytH
MKTDFFRFSRITKIIIVVALCLALISILAINIYYLRDRIGQTFNEIVYTIKLPFRIGKLVSMPPDQAILMPVGGTEVDEITDTWGAPRSEGRTHQGQDIFAARGTKVYSATEGYVIYIGDNRLGGNVVFVLGKGGRRYYYAHLDRFSSIKRLAKVDTNTILGFVGNTGNAETTPPHLHFGVYDRGEAIDPLPFLYDRPNPEANP